MHRAAVVLAMLCCACGHSAEEELAVPEPMPTVHFEKVALELEIYEPHDGTTVARPKLIAAIGSAAAVEAEFTLRPARRHVRRLAIEMTPTSVTADTCELDVRSQVLDDPRLRIAGPPKPTTIPTGEWVDVVALDMVAARIRCGP